MLLIKHNIHYKLFVVLLAVFIFIPILVFAEQPPPPAGQQPPPPEGPKIENPLGGEFDPRVLLGRIIGAALGVVGSIALAMFILGGFTWMTSSGNQEKVKKGKDMILWASIGLAVIFASYVMVKFVLYALTSTGGTPTEPPPTDQGV